MAELSHAARTLDIVIMVAYSRVTDMRGKSIESKTMLRTDTCVRYLQATASGHRSSVTTFCSWDGSYS